jgi:Fur family ferric uptake transcriptional regulator
MLCPTKAAARSESTRQTCVSSELNAILLHLAPACGTVSLVIQDSLRVLQAEGYKITQPRKQVLEVLQASHEPLSPYEIQRLLHKEGKSINHVTIYRTLDLFCNLNLAHRILSSGGFVKCAIESKEGCHRFMLCRRCGALQEFADEELCRQESLPITLAFILSTIFLNLAGCA